MVTYHIWLPLSEALLIKGPYHPSAPIHFCLSYLAEHPHSRGLVLSPNRQDFANALKEYNDEWLVTRSGNGKTCSLTTKITVFYPPTPAHAAFILAMLRVSRPSDGASFNAKTTFDIPPSLVILHEPSSYFEDSDAGQLSSYTVSSYLSLITHAFASLSYLSGNTPRATDTSFVLFDSRLDQLRLPVLRQSETSGHPPARKESVAFLVQKYFEWVGTFVNISANNEEHKVTETARRMLLHRSGQTEEVSSYQWLENRTPRGRNEKGGAVFVWN